MTLCLYNSLVIFVGGVAFSISHAIVLGEEAEIIKHLTEVKHMKINEQYRFRFVLDLLYLSILGIHYLDYILHY